MLLVNGSGTIYRETPTSFILLQINSGCKSNASTVQTKIILLIQPMYFGSHRERMVSVATTIANYIAYQASLFEVFQNICHNYIENIIINFSKPRSLSRNIK